jgi:hypothetical protein
MAALAYFLLSEILRSALLLPIGDIHPPFFEHRLHVGGNGRIELTISGEDPVIYTGWLEMLG